MLNGGLATSKPFRAKRELLLRVDFFHSIMGKGASEVVESYRPWFGARHAIFFIFNLQLISQAGRRRFEPGLPLHLFNNLGKPTDSSLFRLLH
jgi:hypothetical protein